MDKIELENNKERYLRKVPIPPGWNVYTLYETRDKSEKYSFTGGPFGSHLKKEHYTEKGVRIIQLQNIGDGKFLDNYKLYTSEEKADELYSCNIFPHDIIISKMAEPLARACKVPAIEERFLMASDGIRLKVDKDRFDTDFILYTINSWYFRKEAIRKGTGTTRMRIGLSDLKNIRLMAPNLHEQKLVSDILLTWDKAIELKERLIELKKEQKKGLMQKLLTGEVRLPGFNEKWEKVRLGNICSITTGKLDANAMKENGKYKFFTCAKEVYSIDEYAFDTEALLVSGNGANVGYIHYYNGKFNAYQRTYVLDQFSNNILFIKYLLDENLKRRIHKEKNAGNTPYITMGTLSDMYLSLPSQVEQYEIAKILEKSDYEIDLLEKDLEYVKNQKQGLMQLLLTGKVRVKV